MHKDSEDYRSGFDFGYARGKADSKGAALQTIADALTVIAYLKCLGFTNGPGTPIDRDREAVTQLEYYLADRLPGKGARNSEQEDDGGA